MVTGVSFIPAVVIEAFLRQAKENEHEKEGRYEYTVRKKNGGSVPVAAVAIGCQSLLKAFENNNREWWLRLFPFIQVSHLRQYLGKKSDKENYQVERKTLEYCKKKRGSMTVTAATALVISFAT